MGEDLNRRILYQSEREIELMIETIKNILSSMTEVSDWIITEEQSASKELFFVKDKLDMNRGTDIHEFAVRVFVDFQEGEERYKGDADVVLSPLDSVEELTKKLEQAAFSAKFVKNKWYPLPVNTSTEYPEMKKSDNIKSLHENYDDLHQVFYQDYGYTSKVNSCEVFAIEGTKRVVTSTGCDCTYPKNEFTFEIVTDCNEGEEPVEIFNGYYLTEMDLQEIERITKKQLMETEGRSKAVRNATLSDMRVILSGDAVEEFFQFYLQQASDVMVYTNIGKARIGQAFQSKDAKEPITVKMKPNLETSIYARPVDAEGTVLKEYDLMYEGEIKALRTTAKFSHYLGIEHVGTVNTFEVLGGKESLEEYKKQDYLEILTFSCFLADEITGDFGGEFRLAKLVQNGTETFVTGGAISENIFNIQNQMRFSREQEVRRYSVTPSAIIFDGVTVSGE